MKPLFLGWPRFVVGFLFFGFCFGVATPASGKAASTAAKAAPVFEIDIQEGGTLHRYSISEDSKKTQLLFEEGRKNSLRQNLSATEFNFFLREATRLLWAAKHRAPSSATGEARATKCSEYATLTVNGESTSICKENRLATGKALGFMNALHSSLKAETTRRHE